MAELQQGLLKDLISTVEKKISGPLGAQEQMLTKASLTAPSGVRAGLTAGGPALSNVQIEGAVAPRRAQLQTALTGTLATQAATTTALSSFFTGLTGLAQQELSSARQPKFDLVTTAEGLRAFDPSSGKFVGGVLGQAPSELSATERSNAVLTEIYADLRDDISQGITDIGELSAAYPQLTVEEIQTEVDALKVDKRSFFQRGLDLLNPLQ